MANARPMIIRRGAMALITSSILNPSSCPLSLSLTSVGDAAKGRQLCSETVQGITVPYLF